MGLDFMLKEKAQFFSVYPPETAQHVLHQIREQLELDKGVYVAGELDRTYSGLLTAHFIIAPSQPISVLDVDTLNKFMNRLVIESGLPPEKKDEFRPCLIEKVYSDEIREVAGVNVGQVEFKEIIGLVFEDKTRRVVAYQPEALKRKGVNIEEGTTTEMRKIYKLTTISIYPEAEIAYLSYQFLEGMLSEKLRRLYDGTTSIFEELVENGVVTLDDIDMLHNGELEKVFRHIQKESKDRRF